ncbi:hypothetical protein ACL02S_13805 [Nocardia sp. 004]|uniref:hypothetical protein n=1 Tax=Nocardia sp. 004 TaxID=3385978 RepID=UPI00399F561B
MTDFDKLYQLVQEMNRDWDQLITDIRSGARRAQRAAERHQVPVVDQYSGVEYGTLSVDGSGALISIHLEPYEVCESNEQSVITALVTAINFTAAKPQLARIRNITGDGYSNV